jgi:AcrR family transcriptional regulator
VYRYFRDVDHVVDAVLVEHAAAATGAVTEALSRSRRRTVAGVFHLVLDTHLRLYAARPDLTVTWASEALSRRRREIEVDSDRSLAQQVGRHLADNGLIARLSAREERLLDAHWTTAGTLLGVVLASDDANRTVLLDELRHLVDYFATRYEGPATA